ncbi:MAG: HAMP domain-containing histidine kinase [Planctomycetes bacterium]|nr:HAMP domain-containing histidine kinase [Planctomycetota bacterium]
MNPTRPIHQKRTALLLYALLLVLPFAVLGGLQWRQIGIDLRSERARIPEEARRTAQRLTDAIKRRVDRLLLLESQRNPTHFAEWYTPPGTSGESLQLLQSPLHTAKRPAGVVAWLAYDLFGEVNKQPPLLLLGDGQQQADEDPLWSEGLKLTVGGIFDRNLAEDTLKRASRVREVRESTVELVEVAVLCSYPQQATCLRTCLGYMRGQSEPLSVSDFHLQCAPGVNGDPVLFATRRMIVSNYPEELASGRPCLKPLVSGPRLTQGLLLDPRWFLEVLPAEAADEVLGANERLILDPAVPPGQASFDILSELGVELDSSLPPELGRASIAIDSAAMEQRYRTQRVRFLGLALMLIVSLAFGLVSLWRSVTQQIEQVRRMENFVAAVTHELRTPLSAIRLHGEMLLDGWTTSGEQQQEYYRRIVRETGRLSSLVERVLEKSRLTSGQTRAVPGDLNHEIRRLQPSLALGALQAEPGQAAEPARDEEPSDLVFLLEDDVPQVFLTSEAIATLVSNLVENARKYAPVDRRAPGWEPIRISTRRDGSTVLLEVADRGPGIPPEESEKIFEAFYRIGNEATRTAPGTGLGLHLCYLQARAIGGEISVHARDGGGSVFRVRLEPVD